jgi:3-deoxy-7-phosphoheptulonate synthase
MVEVHNQPDQALSDGMQSLYPDQFDELMAQVRQIAAVVGRTVTAITSHSIPVPGSDNPLSVGAPAAD